MPKAVGMAVMQTEAPRCAWPRTCRIRRRPDFKLCYDVGRRYFSRYFVLFVRARTEPGWRVGLAVTKKMGNAARRNRIKRVLREFFRLHGHIMPCGIDVVAVPKRDLVGVAVDYTLVRDELLPLLGKVAHVRGRGVTA